MLNWAYLANMLSCPSLTLYWLLPLALSLSCVIANIVNVQSPSRRQVPLWLRSRSQAFPSPAWEGKGNVSSLEAIHCLSSLLATGTACVLIFTPAMCVRGLDKVWVCFPKAVVLVRGVNVVGYSRGSPTEIGFTMVSPAPLRFSLLFQMNFKTKSPPLQLEFCWGLYGIYGSISVAMATLMIWSPLIHEHGIIFHLFWSFKHFQQFHGFQSRIALIVLLSTLYFLILEAFTLLPVCLCAQLYVCAYM